jgi:hypothetical protein
MTGRAHRKRVSQSNPLFPLARVAAAVETCDDQEGIGLTEKKECVGKFLHARPPQSFKDHGELPGIVGHSVHYAVDFGAKVTA